MNLTLPEYAVNNLVEGVKKASNGLRERTRKPEAAIKQTLISSGPGMGSGLLSTILLI